MLIECFLSIKSLPNLLFGVLCLPGDQSHPFAQPTINPLACCICWAGLLGRTVFPPWNEGPNSGSYIISPKLCALSILGILILSHRIKRIVAFSRYIKFELHTKPSLPCAVLPNPYLLCDSHV